MDIILRLLGGDNINDILVILLEDIDINNGYNIKVTWWRQHQ